MHILSLVQVMYIWWKNTLYWILINKQNFGKFNPLYEVMWDIQLQHEWFVCNTSTISIVTQDQLSVIVYIIASVQSILLLSIHRLFYTGYVHIFT